MTPSAVRTPVTRPPACSMPVTRVEPWKRAPRASARRASATTARDALARPSLGMCRPPRMRSRSTSGCSRTHSSASTTCDSTPQEVAQPCLRCRSASRSGVVATSRPPTWLKHQAPSTSMPASFSTVYLANAVIVLEALVWKTRPGACDDEPPVSGRGPWSSTVTRSQPRAVSSSARLAPTIPAPMMTTFGVADIPSLLTAGIRRADDGASADGGGGELEGRVEEPVGQVTGEGRPDQDGVLVAGVGQAEEHDAGLTECGLGAAPGAEHPGVQVDRTALGQDV